MQTKVKALLLLAFLSFGSQAETFTISGKAHCIYPPLSNSKVQAGTALQFQLAPGTYNVSLASNNMSCMNGSLTNGCLISSVYLQGGLGNGRWGTTINSTPMTLNIPTTSTMMAFVTDDNCVDNTGYATIQATKVQ
ncbi:hypothetical protein B1H58_15275 [Pantoea alhagi]|uniref:Uncharacterized protein n=1 Tax=Pantoea alhagi TaxID=1891675 RepID=A0A1W6B867_9GAMM|nr:hypothetical protein [Pantoea alhagi]ARJ43259.1 hypothetical protein B1H58_15275 [Pantoea alhagi]